MATRLASLTTVATALWWASTAAFAQAKPPMSLEAGRQAYESRCGGCHALDADRVGPHHRHLIGRRSGTVPGFAYSEALQRANIIWTHDTLELWLRDPEALVPGQQMGYRVDDPSVRQLIIGYLAAVSSTSPTP